MATRFMDKALATAALGIALSLLPAATTTTSPASSDTEGNLLLDPPAAPSNCRGTTVLDNHNDFPIYIVTVTWSDNSTNEAGFTVEEWAHLQGVWVLTQSVNRVANSTGAVFSLLRRPHGVRFRVKAFNASGNSAWSNWAH